MTLSCVHIMRIIIIIYIDRKLCFVFVRHTRSCLARIQVCCLRSCTEHGKRMCLCDDARLLLMLYHSWFFCPSHIHTHTHTLVRFYAIIMYFHTHLKDLNGFSRMLSELSLLLLLKICLICYSVSLPPPPSPPFRRYSSLYQQTLTSCHWINVGNKITFAYTYYIRRVCVFLAVCA